MLFSLPKIVAEVNENMRLELGALNNLYRSESSVELTEGSYSIIDEKRFELVVNKISALNTAYYLEECSELVIAAELSHYSGKVLQMIYDLGSEALQKEIEKHVEKRNTELAEISKNLGSDSETSKNRIREDSKEDVNNKRWPVRTLVQVLTTPLSPLPS